MTQQRMRTAAALLAVSALILLTALRVHPDVAGAWPDPRWHVVVLTAGAWLAFLLAAWCVRGVPVRSAVALILVGGAAGLIAASSAPPRSSDDLNRYVWDGRVQAAGIDPYGYVPAAPRLTGLRDPYLWPGQPTDWCVPAGMPDPDAAGVLTPGCTLINRPAVHTIYPPVAEAYFLAVHELSPPGSRYKPVQLAAAALALATTIALLVCLRVLRRDVRLAALWAWCPLPLYESGNGAHVDVLGALLTVCALAVLARSAGTRGGFGGGLLLGLAVAAKLTPVFALPAALRHRTAVVGVGVLGAVAAVYAPHVAVVGAKVVGYIPGYLSEQGYESGGGFLLLGILVPGAWAPLAAVAIVAVAGLLVYYRADARAPWRGALTVTAVVLLVTTPPYPWYALLLCALVALDGRPEWLAIAAARFLSTVFGAAGWGPAGAQRLGYGLALALVLGGTYIRLRARAATAAPPGPPSLPRPRSPLSEAGAAPIVDVVLPCLDEAGALPYVLSRLPNGYRAIVVDNGSTDGSGEIAAGLGALVVREPARGFGAACHAGLLAATAPVVCFCDCDGSFDPAQLPRVAEPVLAGAADLALGRRRPVTLGAWPPHARFANLVLARRLRRAGVGVRDLGPMRAARRSALLGLCVADRRSGYPLETVLAAARAGWLITETDVDYAPRTGRSKVTGTVAGTVQAVRDMNRVWREVTLA